MRGGSFRLALSLLFCFALPVAAVETPKGGAYFTRENCESLVREGKTFGATIPFDHALVLKALGYTDEDVARRLPTHPEDNSWMLFYSNFFRRGDGELQHRLKDLPDFSRE